MNTYAENINMFSFLYFGLYLTYGILSVIIISMLE